MLAKREWFIITVITVILFVVEEILCSISIYTWKYLKVKGKVKWIISFKSDFCVFLFFMWPLHACDTFTTITMHSKTEMIIVIKLIKNPGIWAEFKLTYKWCMYTLYMYFLKIKCQRTNTDHCFIKNKRCLIFPRNFFHSLSLSLSNDLVKWRRIKSLFEYLKKFSPYDIALYVSCKEFLIS